MIQPGDVVEVVCACFGVTPANLRSPARTRACSEPRKIAAYLMREHTIMSLQDICSYFKRSDHTTALYWIRSCRKDINDGSLYMIAVINQLTEMLNSLPTANQIMPLSQETETDHGEDVGVISSSMIHLGGL